MFLKKADSYKSNFWRIFAGYITVNCYFHKMLLVADNSVQLFGNDAVRELANEQ